MELKKKLKIDLRKGRDVIMNVNVDFKKIYNDYAKDKIEDLGFIKANSERITYEQIL